MTHLGGSLARAAWMQLGDADAADDVAQETLIAAWDGAPRTTESTPLRSWLFGILFNRCRHYRRSLFRLRRRERSAPAHLAAPPDENREKLRQSLSELEPPLREVVVCRFLEELSLEETAAALGVAEGTVKSRTHRAIAELRLRLRDAP